MSKRQHHNVQTLKKDLKSGTQPQRKPINNVFYLVTTYDFSIYTNYILVTQCGDSIFHVAMRTLHQ